MAAMGLKPLIGVTMTFAPEDIRPFQTPHNDAFVIQIKIVIPMVHQIPVSYTHLTLPTKRIV